jgi:predicted component of type VI protein secretion system
LGIKMQREPKVRLVFTQPEFDGQWCELMEGKMTVGRSSKNDIVIRDESVSAEHCEVMVNWNEVIVRERGSHNGTFVNEVRVPAQSGVKHGQTIRFGRVVARLELDGNFENTATDMTATPGLRQRMDSGMDTDQAIEQKGVTIGPLKQLEGTSSTPTPEESSAVFETVLVRAPAGGASRAGGRRELWAGTVLIGGLVLLFIMISCHYR